MWSLSVRLIRLILLLLRPMSKIKVGRWFAVVSYCPDTDTLLADLMAHQRSIRAYALIKHDKDETDTHHHIVIRTYNVWSCLAVAKWFSHEGENAFAQFAIDREGIIDYLTHEHNADKANYDKSDIIFSGMSDLLPQESGVDESMCIINDILSGVSVLELVRRYGRDFIYHNRYYYDIAGMIERERASFSDSSNYTK